MQTTFYNEALVIDIDNVEIEINADIAVEYDWEAGSVEVETAVVVAGPLATAYFRKAVTDAGVTASDAVIMTRMNDIAIDIVNEKNNGEFERRETPEELRNEYECHVGDSDRELV